MRDHMEPRRFTRQELYDLVWSTPMTALAPKFGISDVALRKRCQNHEIPTPGVGYWAQVAVGRPPERPRLPPAPAHLEHIVFEVRDPGSSPRPTVPVVEVARKLSEPHPTVAWLERQLNAAEPDQHGRLVVGPKWSPSAALSSPCRNRAARLLDAFCKALEQRGHEVQARTRGQNASYEEILVVAFEKELSIELEEKLARKPHVLTPNERRDKERWEKSGWGSW